MKGQTLVYQKRKITYYSQGDISKKAIVFLHGNSLSSKTFTKQFKEINNIPLLAIDMPGHGLSEKALQPDNVYSILGYIDVLKFVLNELNITNYILAGHSLGGHIALESSDELIGLKGLILFGTPPLGQHPNLDKAFLSNEAIPLLFQNQLSETEIDLLSEAITDNENKVKIQNEIRISDGDARSFLAASIPKGLLKNEIGLIANLNFPVAILHGASDTLINQQYFDELKIPTLWKNKIHIVENSKHCPQIENTTLFNSMIISFYNSIFISNSTHKTPI